MALAPGSSRRGRRALESKAGTRSAPARRGQVRGDSRDVAPEAGSPLLTTKHAVVPEDREVKPTGQHEQVWAEAREEAGEAGGLCAKVAEGPDDQDAMRVEAEEIVVGGIQLCGFNQLGGRGCTPHPGGEIGHVGR